MEFPVIPLSDRVIIKLMEINEKTPGGIVLPGATTNAKYRTAEVVAVGRGSVQNGQIIAPEVKVGDVVQINARTGDEIMVNDEKFTIIPERLIIAVINVEKASVSMA